MNGTQIYTRIATPSDTEKLRAMFARSSSETVYRRFHTPFPEVPGWMVSLMLDADHYDKEALVTPCTRGSETAQKRRWRSWWKTAGSRRG